MKYIIAILSIICILATACHKHKELLYQGELIETTDTSVTISLRLGNTVRRLNMSWKQKEVIVSHVYHNNGEDKAQLHIPEGVSTLKINYNPTNIDFRYPKSLKGIIYQRKEYDTTSFKELINNNFWRYLGTTQLTKKDKVFEKATWVNEGGGYNYGIIDTISLVKYDISEKMNFAEGSIRYDKIHILKGVKEVTINMERYGREIKLIGDSSDVEIINSYRAIKLEGVFPSLKEINVPNSNSYKEHLKYLKLKE